MFDNANGAHDDWWAVESPLPMLQLEIQLISIAYNR